MPDLPAGLRPSGRPDDDGSSSSAPASAGSPSPAACAGTRVDVTLVDRNNFHTFLPLLYQVASAGPERRRRRLRRAGHRAPARQRDLPPGTVTAVDWDAGTVSLDGGDRRRALPFDHLVVAAGATAEYFGIPGAAEHALPLYSLADAAALRNHVLARFEAADADPAAVADGALTFVVVGGGPTGVEMAGALSELFSVVLRRDFPHLDVGSGPGRCSSRWARTSCRRSAPQSRADARATLESRGVEVRTGTAVTAVEADPRPPRRRRGARRRTR